MSEQARHIVCPHCTRVNHFPADRIAVGKGISADVSRRKRLARCRPRSQ